MKKIAFLFVISALMFNCNFFSSLLDSGEEEPVYAVYYDGNGYTDGSVPVFSEYHEDDMILISSAGTMLNRGYTFTGWNTESDGTGTQYSSGSRWAMGNSDVILYARWSPGNDPIITIVYNPNGGSGIYPIDSNSYVAGDSVTLPDVGTMTYAGYNFAGWNTESDRSGTQYTSSETITIEENLRLFACWDE